MYEGDLEPRNPTPFHEIGDDRLEACREGPDVDLVQECGRVGGLGPGGCGIKGRYGDNGDGSSRKPPERGRTYFTHYINLRVTWGM